jgi:hypothetical protein
MKHFVYRLLFVLRIFRIISILFCRKQIAILMYHGSSDAMLHDGIENCSNNHVFVEHFKQQVRFLKRFFNVVSLDRALELLRSGRGFPSNTTLSSLNRGLI